MPKKLCGTFSNNPHHKNSDVYGCSKQSFFDILHFRLTLIHNVKEGSGVIKFLDFLINQEVSKKLKIVCFSQWFDYRNIEQPPPLCKARS